MKSLLFVILVFIIAVQTVQAQMPNSKMSIDLYRYWHNSEIGEKTADSIPVLIKGEPKSIEALTEKHKGLFKYSVGDISSVIIPQESIKVFYENPAVKRMEYRKVISDELFYEDSTADNNNNIRPVHQGVGILPHGFRGEGIVLGIIDDGFEWKHPDFLNNDSTTRIKYLWDQYHINPNFFEDFYAYGSSWDASEINSGLITHTPGVHGSHVLGTAAGNSRAANKYTGIAPESDIIAVSINEGSGGFLSSFVDGIHYIFSKAGELQEPCAINSSLGTYYGSHDGRDLYTAFIDSMLTIPGRALIQAAGNARQHNIHWQAELTASNDTARVWLEPVTTSNAIYAYAYSDTADFNRMNFSLEWIDRVNYNLKGSTVSFNVLRDFDLSNGLPALLKDTLFYSGGFPVILEIYIEQWAGVYEIYFEIYNRTNTTDYWQLTLSGPGKLDMWSNSTVMGSSNLLMNGAAAHYINPDNEQSIVGFWTCSDKVITVSSYQNMAWLENYNGDTVSMSTAGWLPPGISHFSSLGPTRDGRQKPDITAPGGQVMSAAPLSTLVSHRSSGFAYLDKEGWHVSNRGTSMSAPMVAGAAALYLQCRPEATAVQIKAALEASARIDTCVFAQSQLLPNIHWGYGKLDVYNLISGCMVYGCTDSAAFNYNPAAHLDDGSCFLVSNVNVLEDAFLQIAPNPFSNTLQIQSNLPESQEGQLQIFDLLGQELWSANLKSGTQQLIWDGSKYPAGIYIVKMSSSGKQVRTVMLSKL